jgi:hypothetical protein
MHRWLRSSRFQFERSWFVEIDADMIIALSLLEYGSRLAADGTNISPCADGGNCTRIAAPLSDLWAIKTVSLMVPHARGLRRMRDQI